MATEKLETHSESPYRTARWLAATSIALGTVALVGWATNILVLRSLVPGLSEMKANTAAAAALGGVALWAVVTRQRGGRCSATARVAAIAAGSLVALIGALTLAEHAFGWSLGIDELLFRDRSGAPFTDAPGRMARNTAFSFFLIGAAFALWDWKPTDRSRPSHWLAVLAAGVSFAGLVGYFFSITVLLQLASFTGMSVQTSVALLCLSLGALLALPDSVLTRILRAPGPGGLLARRMLPAILLLPLAIGWLRLVGEHVGLTGTGSGVSAMVASLVLVQAFVLYVAVAETERLEAERSAHEETSRRSRLALRESADRLARHDARMEALATASHTFADAGLDFQEILRRLTRAVAEDVGDYCSIRLLDESGRLRLAALHHPDPEAAALVRRLSSTQRTGGVDGTFGAVLSTGEPVFVPSGPPETMRSRVPAEFGSYHEQRPIHALIVVPLRAHDRRVGVLTAWRERPDDPYAAHDLVLLQDLADQAALAVDNARLFEASHEASRSKSEFLAIISHELRTPLNVILGHVDLLEMGIGGTLSAKQAESVDRVKFSGNHLKRIVDELIDYAQLEAGRSRLDLGEVEVRPVVDAVVAEVRPDLASKELEVRLDVPDDLRFVTDAGRLRQVLLNLMTNAVRFTDEGAIRISAAVDAGEVRFEVADTGIGIATEHFEPIFEPFWQVEHATTRSYGGTGLGLSLSRRLARLMGGDIEVQSEAGRGSTFTLRLPLHPDPTGLGAGDGVD